MEYSETRILKFARACYDLVQRSSIKKYSSKYSKRTFTQHQHVAVLCIKRKKKLKYRELEEFLMESPRVCEELELKEFPDFTTSCKQFDKFKRKVLVILVYMSACLLPRSGKGGIDATGYDRRHNSKHYVKRCKMTIHSMKITFLVDLKHLTILAVHITASRKHDSQIALPLIEQYEEEFEEFLESLCADKGYDSKEIRNKLRKHGTRPLIPYREFKKKHAYWNTLFIKDDLHQRVKCESVNSMTKRNYGDTLMSRWFYNQFKEVLLIAIVHNIDRSIVDFIGGFQQSCDFTIFETISFHDAQKRQQRPLREVFP